MKSHMVTNVLLSATLLIDLSGPVREIGCITSVYDCLQCFDAVGWAAGRASGLQKTEWWGAGVVICLERGADLHGPADAAATHCLLLQ